MQRIRITVGDLTLHADLTDSHTSRQILDALPLASQAQRWGDEVYFTVPVEAPEESPRAEVPSGTVAYWPPGRALCLFFGQQPYSPVNVVGRIDGDEQRLASTQEGATVRVERV